MEKENVWNFSFLNQSVNSGWLKTLSQYKSLKGLYVKFTIWS